MEPIPPRLFQFTIGALLRLVLGAGLLCVFLTPIIRTDIAGHQDSIALVIFGLPMVVGVLVLVLARRGPCKCWLLILVFLPFAVGAAACCGVDLIYFVRGERNPLTIPLVLWFGLFFAWVSHWMIRQLIPQRCPRCQRWGLLPDPATDPVVIRICVVCGRRSQRNRSGPWEPIDDCPVAGQDLG